MKKMILKWMYRRYKTEFEDLMIRDYLAEIPDNVAQDLQSMFESQKTKLRKGLDFLAFNLHQKMRTDSRNSERYQGMFIQLKLFDAILKTKPDQKIVTPAQVKKEEKTFDYESVIDNAIKKGKESNAQG